MLDQAIENTRSFCFIEAMRSLAARNPDQPAILAPNRPELSFAALLEHSEHTAGVLNGFGLKRGDCVALMIPNSPELVGAMLTIMTACTIVVLNPDFKADEFRLLLQRSHASALILPHDLASPVRATAEACGVRVIHLSASPQMPAGCFQLEGARFVTPTFAEADDVAVLMPTSGTTGIPKLVPYTHRQLMEDTYMSSWRLLPPNLEGRKLLINLLPLFHLFGFSNLTTSLGHGFGIVAGSEFNVDDFYTLLDSYRPVGCRLLPAMLKMIVEAAPAHSEVIARSSIRMFASSAAALSAELVANLERTFQTGISSTYGMTEIATISWVFTSRPDTCRAGSVGKPLRETAIMGEDGHLLPAGEQGEVVVRSSNFPGYSDDPEARTRFVTAGWFHTGDIGYLDDDNFLFIIGRIKEIINRGGEKISPYEVEDVLLRHPAVQEAAVFGVPHTLLGEDLAAAVVVRDPAVSGKDLRLFSAQHLPPQKVPGIIQIVETIPKTPTHKIRRLALPELLGLGDTEKHKQSRGEFTPPVVQPRTPVEHQLAQMWREGFKVPEISIHDDFFSLGGTSLLAAQLVIRIGKAFQIKLPVSSFLEAPTIAEMAHLLDHLSESISYSSVIPIQPLGEATPLFCVPGLNGQVLTYRDLAIQLGMSQPLYGLQTPGSDGKTLPFTRMEDLAAHFVEAIRVIQPHGPYQLAGHSFGGLVALEMAQILNRQGERVALLAIFDTGLGAPVKEKQKRRMPKPISRVLRRLKFYRTELEKLDRKAQFQYMVNRVQRKLKSASQPQPQAKIVRGLLPGVEAIAQANRQITREYQPQPYQQPIVYFLATQTRDAQQSLRFAPAWRKIAQGDFQVYEVPGEHKSLLKASTSFQVIGEHLKRLLKPVVNGDSA